jgi:hypothetical protein
MQVLHYAKGRLGGPPVLPGQCTALADEALRNAGGRSAADFGRRTEDGDYIWGTAVSLSDVRPGDILQFRDYHYTRREEKDDGSWK